MNQELVLKMESLWGSIIKKATGMDDDTADQLKLSSGASEEDFLEVEKELNVRLPDEMKAFYSIHNGQNCMHGGECLVKNLELLDTKSIINQWKFLNEEFDGDDLEISADSKIKPMLWNPKWIPIADNGGGDYVCLDTDPTIEGSYGQVFYFYHDDGGRRVRAKSISDFFEKCITENT